MSTTTTTGIAADNSALIGTLITLIVLIADHFRNRVVRRIDNHAVRAAERLFLTVCHDGRPVTQPEVKGRPPVESELAFRGAGKNVRSDAGCTGERIDLDPLERLDAGRREQLGAYQARAVVRWL